jgi:hypothetical protein
VSELATKGFCLLVTASLAIAMWLLKAAKAGRFRLGYGKGHSLYSLPLEYFVFVLYFPGYSVQSYLNWSCRAVVGVSGVLSTGTRVLLPCQRYIVRGGIRPRAVSCVIWSGPADLAEENGVHAAPQGISYVILTGRAGPDGKRSEKELEKRGEPESN